MWALIDQGLSSGTNFAIGVVLARSLGPQEFGAFAIAFTVWLGAQGVLRTFIVQPYVVEAASATSSAWTTMSAHAAGAVVWLGVVVGCLTGIGGVIVGLDASVGTTLAVLGGFVPVLALQDFWRQAAFAKGQPKVAAANDGVWAGVQTAGLLVLLFTDSLSAGSAVAAWGSGAGAGATLGIRQLEVMPDFSRAAFRFARAVGGLGAWFTASNLVYIAGSQAAILLIAGGAGRAAVGGLRATMNLFAPVQLITLAGEAVGLPDASRAAREGPRALVRSALSYSRALSLWAGAYCAVPVLLGQAVLTAVFGSEFARYSELIVPMALVSVFGTLGLGAILGLRAARAGRRLLTAQAVVTGLKLGGVVALVGPHGVAGAAWALAGVAGVHAALLWCLLPHAARNASSRRNSKDQLAPSTEWE